MQPEQQQQHLQELSGFGGLGVLSGLAGLGLGSLSGLAGFDGLGSLSGLAGLGSLVLVLLPEAAKLIGAAAETVMGAGAGRGTGVIGGSLTKAYVAGRFAKI